MSSKKKNAKQQPYIIIAGETLGLGGSEKVTVDLANALAEGGRRRVGVLLTLASEGLFKPLLDAGIAVLSCTGGGEREFLSLLSAEKPDVLLFNNCRLARNCISEIEKLKLAPAYLGFLLHGHSRFSMDMLPEKLPERAHILTISDEAARGILKQRNDIVGAVDVLPNGVDTERFRPSLEGEMFVSPWPGSKGPIFGYCGRFSGEKALVTMVDCFRRAKTRLPEARLMLVGGTDPGVPMHEAYWNAERRMVEQLIRQMKLEDCVHITGAVSDPETYYRQMDVFLLTSHFEGMPLAALEAIASGLPMVTTSVGAMPELAASGAVRLVAKSGLDLNATERDYYAAQMVEAAQDTNRREIGLKGRLFVERNYSLRRYCKSVQAYFAEKAAC